LFNTSVPSRFLNVPKGNSQWMPNAPA
jgi:hypothetical protein